MGSWHSGLIDTGVWPEEGGTAGERGSCTLRIQEMCLPMSVALEMGLAGVSHREGKRRRLETGNRIIRLLGSQHHCLHCRLQDSLLLHASLT